MVFHIVTEAQHFLPEILKESVRAAARGQQLKFATINRPQKGKSAPKK